MTVNKRLPSLNELLSITLTFILVVVGWVIFRAKSLSQLMGFFHSLFSNSLVDSNVEFFYLPFATIVAMLMVEWITREKQHVLEQPLNGILRKGSVRWAVYYLLILVIYGFGGYAQEFIYFQF